MRPSPSRCSSSRPLVIGALALFLVYQFATYKGLPIVLVVMALLIALFVFVTKRMTIGRRIYAMGGNAKAAQLSGIKTERLTLIVFINMGVLSALGGLIIAARLGQAVPAAGLGSELDVIAAVFIGGASAMGGVGQVIGVGGRRLHHGRHEQRHVDHGRQRRLAAGRQGPGAARRRGVRRLQQEQGLSGAERARGCSAVRTVSAQLRRLRRRDAIEGQQDNADFGTDGRQGQYAGRRADRRHGPAGEWRGQRLRAGARGHARAGRACGPCWTSAGSAKTVDLAAAYAEGRLNAPISHPDPAHLHLTGTGLTHLGSAATRDSMHKKLDGRRRREPHRFHEDVPHGPRGRQAGAGRGRRAAGMVLQGQRRLRGGARQAADVAGLSPGMPARSRRSPASM